MLGVSASAGMRRSIVHVLYTLTTNARDAEVGGTEAEVEAEMGGGAAMITVWSSMSSSNGGASKSRGGDSGKGAARSERLDAEAASDGLSWVVLSPRSVTQEMCPAGAPTRRSGASIPPLLRHAPTGGLVHEGRTRFCWRARPGQSTCFLQRCDSLCSDLPEETRVGGAI